MRASAERAHGRSAAAAGSGPRPSSGAGAPRPSGRIPGVDGLRAAAALWVVLFHMHAFSGVRLWPGVDDVAAAGSAGVGLFLVLSGFCLFAPFAGDRLGRFRTLPFLLRRCRRLLPAYYVTLIAFLALHVLADGRWGLPRYSPGEYVAQAVTHVLLVHQLFPSTFFGLNGAYWSLGLEWELYLALPLVVAGIVRWGLRRTLLGVTAVSLLYLLAVEVLMGTGVLDVGPATAQYVLPNLFLGRWFEFALGVLAAELYMTHRLHGRLPLLWLLAAPAAVVSVLAQSSPLNNVVQGVVFFTLLCTVLAGDNLVARVCAARPLVALGVMSYSLYLVHQPVVEGAAVVALEAGLRADQAFLVLVGLFPVVFGLAWALFVTVEKPSMQPGGPRRAHGGAR